MEPSLAAEVLDALRDAVGDAHVLTDPELTAGYVRDWTGRFVGATPAVVRPGSVDEVAAVLRCCDRARVAVVPQGGNTGLVGGSVPLSGEVVVSLRRLAGIGPVDFLSGQVTAQAGVTLTALADHVRPQGLTYGVDLAARDSATVGGTVATNAGGIHLMRWGATRQQVVGIEAVRADGTVLRHLGGLVKDNTGYDLAGLLCGSEGTLAVVTAARLRLVPRYEHVVAALAAFDTIDDAVRAVASWRRHLDALDAAELFVQSGLELVCTAEGLSPPFRRPWPVYVLIEASDHSDPTDDLAALVDGDGSVRDVAVAADQAGRAALWAYREGHTTAINTLGPPHKLDVTLPLAELAGFTHEVPELVGELDPGAAVWIFGHVGDGNLHVNVTGLEPDDDTVDDAILEAVARRGGSISAEHGIGTAKRRWLGLNRSPEELRTFAGIKRALDPNGILNPGVLMER